MLTEIDHFAVTVHIEIDRCAVTVHIEIGHSAVVLHTVTEHFAVTVPAVMVVSVEGLASCVDPALLQWFSYVPRKQAAGSTSSDVGPVTAAAVDMPLAKATSPLQTGGSHSEFSECVSGSRSGSGSGCGSADTDP